MKEMQQSGERAVEMLKMKIDPDMSMKTKGAMTKCPANYMAFTIEMQQTRPD